MGYVVYGGNSSPVSQYLKSGVVEIISNGYAFAAIKDDGSVVSWGDSGLGGTNRVEVSANAAKVVANGRAFAAILEDGTVHAWGNSSEGGSISRYGVQDQLKDVVDIVGNEEAFVAIKADGSVVTWGNTNYGGNSTSVSQYLQGGVKES